MSTVIRKNLLIITAALALLIIVAASHGVGQAGRPSTESSSSVYRFEDLSEIDGAVSRLVRTDDAIAMELHTHGLEPNAAYTVWWVIFNSPQGCSEPCDLDDLFNADGTMNVNPDAAISVLWADGAISTEDGRASFSGLLPQGRPLGEVVFGPGLVDAYTAEVHLVVRSHGPADLGRLYLQLHTFEPHPILGGDCVPCQDQHFSVHLPPRN